MFVCVAILFASAVVAVSIRAQKRADSPADSHPAHKDEKAHTEDEKAHVMDAKSHADCPMMGGDSADTHDVGSAHKEGGDHDAHLATVNAHGEQAMGFSQTETTHHFILTRDGGIIQVEVNGPADTVNLERVRQHLAHISRMFAEGDFRTPLLVHERTPPGVPVMERLKADISYAYEETERGARVRIHTKSPEALNAVQEFLRFQIKDHQTGDATEVENR